jgi:hypothetical protein
MKSWIKIDREITSHWIFKDPWKFRNWIDLLTLVNHQEQKVNIKGVILTCKRGETLCSLDTLAKRWECDKSKVRRFLKLLQSDSMIELKSEQITTRLTICKYELYQGERHANETQVKRKRNASETQLTPNKNEKKEKNDNNENNINTTNVELMSHTKFDFSGFKDFSLASDLWKTWIDYKSAQHRDKFKTPQSEQMAINALQKLCRGDTAIAKQIIEQSMANLYKGLFPLKQQQSNNNQISTQNGTLQERKYAHIHKAIRNLERLGSLSAEQVEVAQRYLAVATGQINSTEFISKLVKYDSRNSKSDFGDIGDSIRIGE